MNAKLNISKVDNPWFVFGVSYSGAMSAWFRLKFPHLTCGSLASSAVVLAVYNFTDFDKQIGVSAGEDCKAVLQEITKLVEEQLSSDGASVKQLFGATMSHLELGRGLVWLGDPKTVFLCTSDVGVRPRSLCEARGQAFLQPGVSDNALASRGREKTEEEGGDGPRVKVEASGEGSGWRVLNDGDFLYFLADAAVIADAYARYVKDYYLGTFGASIQTYDQKHLKKTALSEDSGIGNSILWGEIHDEMWRFGCDLNGLEYSILMETTCDEQRIGEAESVERDGGEGHGGESWLVAPTLEAVW
ncbi:putative serine protease EDA2 [Acorus calamus]|uniref:Serine protease EDA2 n=1 Tax=Acorus calamus TaxID=4465 RepID=A0AAV9DSJ7_ACOCL|nr:putative serine protease EDA2 [Acorus calamus]